MSCGSSHAGAPLDDDAAWRECASYEERFIRPAVLEFQPSGIRLELEQSGGDSSGFDFDQVTVWPAGVVMARALQHPEMAISIAGRRVLELGSGCGVAGLVAAAMVLGRAAGGAEVDRPLGTCSGWAIMASE